MKKIAFYLFRSSDFPGRMRLIRALLSPFRVARSAYGPKMRVRARDYTNLAALSGAYGMQLRDLILRLPKDGVFIDIGANAGIFTLIASAHLQRGRIFSFEPNPVVFADFLRNLEENECRNVLPLNAAIGERGDILELAMFETHSGAGHLTSASPDGPPKRSVACLRMRDLPFLQDIIVGREVVCKIDVEGAERTVIRSLADSGMLAAIDRVFIEICAHHLARFSTDPEDIYADLKAQGFRPTYGLQTTTSSYDELFERN